MNELLMSLIVVNTIIIFQNTFALYLQVKQFSHVKKRDSEDKSLVNQVLFFQNELYKSRDYAKSLEMKLNNQNREKDTDKV